MSDLNRLLTELEELTEPEQQGDEGFEIRGSQTLPVSRIVTCRYCDVIFNPDYARVEWGASICSDCMKDEAVVLDACIKDIEDAIGDIIRHLMPKTLPGDTTGNPIWRLRTVAKALTKLKAKKGADD